MEPTLSPGSVSDMVSRKKYRFNYRTRTFAPVTLIIWATIAVMAIYSYQREKDFREKMVYSDLELITSRLIDIYENSIDYEPFVSFIENYYPNKGFEKVRVTVLNPVTGDVRMSIGKPLRINGGYQERDEYVSYAQQYSKGHEVLAMAALPYDVSFKDWMGSNYGYWIFLLTLSTVATVLIYLYAYHQARNITSLRDFAEKAVNDDETFETDDVSFANDELGEISRRIVDIYKSRNRAVAAHEREHKIALRATEEKIRIRRELTNNVGHELKTPVGIVRGYVDTLVSNPDMDEDSRRHFLVKTQQHVERLCTMLDDLSTLTRLDETGGTLTTLEVDMNILLADIADEIDDSGIGGDMTFVYDVPAHCVVRGSESLINAAIMNLVKNSVAYSKGSEMGVLFTGKTSSHYSFVFYDNGTGVSPEHLPRLFDRFYRIDSGRARKSGGTGLGLPIVKSTFINMGGTISVHNREGGGLEFSFTIPAWKPKN